MADIIKDAGELFAFDNIDKFIHNFYSGIMQTTPEETSGDIEPLAGGLQGRFSHSFVVNIVNNLAELRQYHIYKHMIKAYERGRLSAGLTKVFEMEIPEPRPELRENAFGARTLAQKLIKSKRLDMEPYRGPDDHGPEWWDKYNFTFIPVIGYDVIALTGNIKAIKRALPDEINRIRDTMALQIARRFDADKKAGVDNTDLIQKFAENLSSRAADRTARKKNPGAFCPVPAVYYERFYINPETYKITDLRQYGAELQKLDRPEGWKFAKEYAEMLQEIVAEWRAGQPSKGDIFQGADFIPLKTTPETMAIASVTSGYSIFVQPTLPGIDDETEQTAAIVLSRAESQKTGGKSLTLKIKDKPNGRGLRPSTQKVKTLLEGIFTMTKKTAFVFSVRDYMRMCEAKPPYDGPKYWKFASRLREDLKTLRATSFTANYPGLPAGEISILDSYVPSPGGGMEITLGQRYCRDLLEKGGLSQICRTFWRTDERNPHAIPFLLKLCDNRTMTKNIRKGNKRACTISIKALFDYDSANFPTLEKVKKSRKYKELLIDPIIKTIAQLNDDGQIVSKYVNAKHEEYSAEDLSRVTFADFMDRKRWLLEYEITGFEEDPRLLTVKDTKPKTPKQKTQGRGDHGKKISKEKETGAGKHKPT